MVFSINRKYQWTVGFVWPGIKLPSGNGIVALSIDDSPPFNVTAHTISSEQIGIPLSPDAALFQKFREGHTLRLIVHTVTQTYNLTDTSKVLTTLLNCVQTALHPTQPQPAQAAARPPAAPAEDYRAEATAIVANLLSQAGISGFTISPPGQNEAGRGADASWTAGNISGALFIMGERGLASAADMGPTLIATAAKACKGSFMSGSLPAEALGTQARVFTSCRTGNDVKVVYYLTVKRPRGGYYVFATAGNGAEEPAKEADTNIRTAVFKLVPQP
jgi:hypothetical protein